jgi:regulator of replication initiation timing
MFGFFKLFRQQNNQELADLKMENRRLTDENSTLKVELDDKKGELSEYKGNLSKAISFRDKIIKLIKDDDFTKAKDLVNPILNEAPHEGHQKNCAL